MLEKLMFWYLLAKFLAWPPIADRIIASAATRDYFPIYERGTGHLYMQRWWVFNPHPRDGAAKYSWCPFSIRLHHIVRRDSARALHSHPWPWFRTFILRGWYDQDAGPAGDVEVSAGDTMLVTSDMYHRIFLIPESAVWTLVVTGRRTSDWGFLVNGRHVPHAEYLSTRPKKLTAEDTPWIWIEHGVAPDLFKDDYIQVMLPDGKRCRGQADAFAGEWASIKGYRIIGRGE